MRRVTLWPVVIAILLGMASCAKTPKGVKVRDPWVGSRDDFRRQVKIIAVANVYLPDGMQDPDPIKENFGNLLMAELRRYGFTVVRPQEYETIWNRVVAELGGLEDDSEDQRDHAKIAQAMAQTLDGLRAGFKLDAVLIPSIVVAEAPFAAGRAMWDGTTQSIKMGGAGAGFWSGSPEGRVGALSFSVTILSTSGETIFVNAGGIEVLSKLEGKRFVLVPRDELFTDQLRIENSVRLALKPLFK